MGEGDPSQDRLWQKGQELQNILNLKTTEKRKFKLCPRVTGHNKRGKKSPRLSIRSSPSCVTCTFSFQTKATPLTLRSDNGASLLWVVNDTICSTTEKRGRMATHLVSFSRVNYDVVLLPLCYACQGELLVVLFSWSLTTRRRCQVENRRHRHFQQLFFGWHRTLRSSFYTIPNLLPYSRLLLLLVIMVLWFYSQLYACVWKQRQFSVWHDHSGRKVRLTQWHQRRQREGYNYDFSVRVERTKGCWKKVMGAIFLSLFCCI